MNTAVHQLVRVILEGISWVLQTAAALWLWSWSQIAHVFAMSWGNLAGWKLVLGVIIIAVLAAFLVGVIVRAWDAFGRIARAFWMMAATLVGLLAFVIVAGLFSRGFVWVVASVPDQFWQHLI